MILTRVYDRGAFGSVTISSSYDDPTRASGRTEWSFYWNGPGSAVRLIFGQQLVSIDHPTASGPMMTERDALRAVRAFMAVCRDDAHRAYASDYYQVAR